MITREDIIYFYEQFKKNLDEDISLSESSAGVAESIDVIVEYVQDRKVGVRKIFKKNNELLEKYILPILFGTEPLTPELNDTFVDQIFHYCLEGYTEPIASAVVLLAIERYYDNCPKEEINYDNLIKAYHLLGFCGHDIMRTRESLENGIAYSKKILRHKKDYFNFENEDTRIIINLAQHNICVEMVDNIYNILDDETVDIIKYQKDIMKYVSQALEFYRDEKVREFDGKNYDFDDRIMRTRYIIYGNIIDKLVRSGKILPEILQLAVENLTDLYETELDKNPDVYAMDDGIFCNYWLCQFLDNKIEVEAYIDKIMDYLKHVLANSEISQMSNDDSFYDSQYFTIINNRFANILYFLSETDISHEKKEEITIFCVEKYLEMMEWLPKVKSNTRVNGIIEQSAKDIVKYMPKHIPKYNFILKILANRDESVAVHGAMVRQLSYYIMNTIVEEKPELLIGTLQTESVMDVLVNQEDIVDFVRQASMIFDIGKIFCSEIVQKESRSLLELEKDYIKLHPRDGKAVIEDIEGLKEYSDIILGHHKYYDGSGGYPEDFDINTAKNKFVIDLIRICDCMDAATDDIGRNYKNPISFDQFIQELKDGAGTLYNPDIVEIICDNKKLRKELEECCTSKRVRSLFETIYGQGLATSKENRSAEESKNNLPTWTKNALRVLEVDFYKDSFRTVYRGSLSMEGNFKDGKFSQFNIDDYRYLFAPEDIFKIRQFLDYGTLADKLTINNGTFELETRIRTGDGYRWIRFQVVTTREHFGIPQKIIIIIHDADEQCRKRQKITETLEKVKEEAKSANKAKSLFISNISHEIRTPMNAIVGMVEILLRSDISDEQKSYLMNIKNSGNALLTIINDILDFSKMESGKLEIIETEYDMMAMLGEFSSQFLNRIGDKPVYLNFDIDKNIPMELYGDSLRVRQVITNLMNNAIKFTDKGMVTLKIEVADISEDNIELSFLIKDSGIGIKEEDLDLLFGQFQQIDVKKNYEKEGTGLGLIISKRLVELMGGKISVSSVYGQGSEFSFNIKQKIINDTPAVKVDTQKVPPDIVVGSLTNNDNTGAVKKLCDMFMLNFVDLREEHCSADVIFTDSDNISKVKEHYSEARICILQNPMLESVLDSDIRVTNCPLYSYNFCRVINNETEHKINTTNSSTNFIAPQAKILIVDDTAMNLTVAKGVLQPLMMTIDTANSGMKAIEILKNKQDYDIIFMDHKMPEMDGVETAMCIRSLYDEYYKKVPIIALTANAVVEAREMFFKAGMNDFLSKPIVIKDIMQMIRKWLPKEYIRDVD